MDFLSLVAFQVRIGAHPGHSKTDWNFSSFRTGLWSKTIVTHCSHRFIKREAFSSDFQMLPRHSYIHLFSPCPWLVSLQLRNFSFSLTIELYTISPGNYHIPPYLGKRKIIFKSDFWWDMLVPWRVYLQAPVHFNRHKSFNIFGNIFTKRVKLGSWPRKTVWIYIYNSSNFDLSNCVYIVTNIK